MSRGIPLELCHSAVLGLSQLFLGLPVGLLPDRVEGLAGQISEETLPLRRLFPPQVSNTPDPIPRLHTGWTGMCTVLSVVPRPSSAPLS